MISLRHLANGYRKGGMRSYSWDDTGDIMDFMGIMYFYGVGTGDSHMSDQEATTVPSMCDTCDTCRTLLRQSINGCSTRAHLAGKHVACRTLVMTDDHDLAQSASGQYQILGRKAGSYGVIAANGLAASVLQKSVPQLAHRHLKNGLASCLPTGFNHSKHVFLLVFGPS